jgi:hypothetical protein
MNNMERRSLHERRLPIFISPGSALGLGRSKFEHEEWRKAISVEAAGRVSERVTSVNLKMRPQFPFRGRSISYISSRRRGN